MSRIGNKPVDIPSGVKVAVDKTVVTVEGKSTLTLQMPPMVSVDVKDNQVLVAMASADRRANAMQGLTRSLIQNMVIGVTAGFKKELSIVGIGYKAVLAGSTLTLSLGYSHPIVYEVPAGIKLTVTPDNKIIVEGSDKQLVGQVAATIRRFRKPDPYKGKGIRYVDERIILKEGKSAG